MLVTDEVTISVKRKPPVTSRRGGRAPSLALLEKLPESEIEHNRQSLALVATDDLISRLSVARRQGGGLQFFFLNVELTSRGIAPCFRQWELSAPEARTNLSEVPDWLFLELMLQDRIWLLFQRQHWCDDSWSMAIWKSAFYDIHRFARHKRFEAWLVTKLLKITEDEQWQCRILQSKPVRLQSCGLHESTQRIWSKLEETLPAVMRTGMCRVDAIEVLRRRKRLWYAAEVCGWSPSKTARYYRLIRGDELTPAAVNKQLNKIRHLRRKRRSNPDDESDQ